MGVRLINKLTEKEIVKIWQRQLLPREGLATADDKLLRIIYPGRLNDDRGADFQEAVIVSGRRLLRGDVEIHVNSGGWQEHRHDRDAVYNRVILHVVMWHDSSTPTRLENGREVPVLVLERYVNFPAGQGSDLSICSTGSNLPCFQVTRFVESGDVAGFLDRAGEKRFLVKAAGFQKDFNRLEAGQALYQGVMEALGYSRNKLPFLELARLLPLRTLESLTACDLPEAEWLARRQALLLGTAGPLALHGRIGCPGNRLDDNWTNGLLKLTPASGQPKVMSPQAWHLLRVRPNNSPILRLAAMSYLLLRYREKGWLEGLLGLVRAAPLNKGAAKSMEAGLVVSIDEGVSGQGQSRVTLLGSGRAADIIVNILLPFALAWSRSVSEPDLGGKALALYHLYPRLTLNSVEKHMAGQLGLDTGMVNSARRQQGLIHIYNHLCSVGRCHECQLSK